MSPPGFLANLCNYGTWVIVIPIMDLPADAVIRNFRITEFSSISPSDRLYPSNINLNNLHELWACRSLKANRRSIGSCFGIVIGWHPAFLNV